MIPPLCWGCFGAAVWIHRDATTDLCSVVPEPCLCYYFCVYSIHVTGMRDNTDFGGLHISPASIGKHRRICNVSALGPSEEEFSSNFPSSGSLPAYNRFRPLFHCHPEFHSSLKAEYVHWWGPSIPATSRAFNKQSRKWISLSMNFQFTRHTPRQSDWRGRQLRGPDFISSTSASFACGSYFTGRGLWLNAGVDRKWGEGRKEAAATE